MGLKLLCAYLAYYAYFPKYIIRIQLRFRNCRNCLHRFPYTKNANSLKGVYHGNTLGGRPETT